MNNAKLEKQGADANEIAKATEHLEKMTATLRISVADASEVAKYTGCVCICFQ